MTFKEIQELIKLVKRSNLSEFKLKHGEVQITIRTDKFSKEKAQPAVMPAPQVVPVNPSQMVNPSAEVPSAAPDTAKPGEAVPATPEETSVVEDQLVEIKSPIVGTFYRSPAPEKGPYVKVGDTVEIGSVVCIIEAMKLFNEIESEVSGKIVKVVVEDASPVEYDQVLYLVDPKG